MREWLKFLRKMNKLTLKQVSAETGISVTALSGYESGERRPRVENAKKLGLLLGFDWERFYE